jgi:plastocyanin
MRRTTIIAVVIVIIVIVVVAAAAALFYMPSTNSPGGYSGQNKGSSSTNSVEIKNFAFGPTPLTVSVGTTVTWTNNDTTTHTVTSTSGPTSFDSGNLAQGSTFSYTFNQTGTYDYICTIHPDMHGRVIVQ